MLARKEDDIMAEYLLKGGKMLEKACKTCGCPLFEYKGRTFCVVCAENEKPAEQKKKPAVPPATQKGQGQTSPVPAPDIVQLSEELAGTILALCQRIRDEEDPDRCLTLMDAVKAGSEALQILRQL